MHSSNEQPPQWLPEFCVFVRHLSWTRSRDFPHISGSLTIIPVFFEPFLLFGDGGFHDLALCQGECLCKNKDFQLLDGRGGTRYLQYLTMLHAETWKRQGSFNNSMSKCCIHSLFPTFPWLLFKFPAWECCERKVRENPSTSPTWAIPFYGFWLVFHLHRRYCFSTMFPSFPAKWVCWACCSPTARFFQFFPSWKAWRWTASRKRALLRPGCVCGSQTLQPEMEVWAYVFGQISDELDLSDWRFNRGQ